jgi:asparagine synthase (glutamine-hydrolysing)
MAQECVAGSHEPFADQSLIPTQMLSGLVGREVKVALGGDGGDELFCGYKKYTMFERLERIGGRVPAALRRPLGALACPTSEAVLRLWPKTPRGQRAYKALRSLGGPQALSAMALTRSPLINRFVDPGARARIAAAQAALPAAGILAGVNRLQGLAPTRDRLQLLDQCTYLPDNILRKADRASMAKSLEVRSPLLDDEVARLAWRLKTYTNVDPKDPLLRMMHGLLPQRLCQKEKKGFSPPMARWLTGELRDWGEAQLRRTAELTGGLVDGAAVRWEWARCQKRGMNKMQAQEFWTLIMLNCLRPA